MEGGTTTPLHLVETITRADLEKLVEDLINRTLEPCKKALKDAGIDAKDIADVVLVGGMTRMPRVREKVKELFGREPHTGVNPTPSPWNARRRGPGRRPTSRWWCRCSSRASSSARPSSRWSAHRTAVAVELIIVDDHSGDDSAAVAAELLDDRPWLPAMLVRRATNGGLSVARNTGIAQARGTYVLHARRRQRCCTRRASPRCSTCSADAPDDVVAAYGILERFDETGSVGVTSHLPWDVDLLVVGRVHRRDGPVASLGARRARRLRGTRRRSAGGRTTTCGCAPPGTAPGPSWCRRSSAGYREHAGSMRRISDIDMLESFVILRERHPRLPWPS